jgi:hypothetical protein
MATKVYTLIFKTVAEGFPAVTSSMNAVNTATGQTTQSMTGLNAQAKQIPPVMNSAASGTGSFTGALGNVRNAASSVEGPLNKNNLLAGQSAVAYTTGSKGAETYAASSAKVESTVLPLASKLGGLAFLFAGLTASAGEAAGMQEILGLSQEKVNELTALQAELIAADMQGTDVFSRVTNELEQAQRALTRQQTITNLSTQDQSFYIMALASIAMPAVIKGATSLIAKSKELGGGFTGLASVIGSKLTGGFVTLTEKLHVIPQKFTSAGVSANTFGTALRGLALNPFLIALTLISAAIGIFVTNAFGARDAINAFGVELGNKFPFLKGFLTLLGQAGDALVTLFGGSIRQVTKDAEVSTISMLKLRDSIQGIYNVVNTVPNIQLTPAMQALTDAIDLLNAKGAPQVKNVTDLLLAMTSKNIKPSEDYKNKLLELTSELGRLGQGTTITIAEQNNLHKIMAELIILQDKDIKTLAEKNKALGLTSEGTKAYSGNVLTVASAIEATGVVQDEFVKGLDDTQKSMFDVAKSTGLTGDALKNYLENVEASSGATQVFGEDVVRLDDGSVDLIATINGLAAAEKTHLDGATKSWNGIVGLVDKGIITYDGAALAIKAIAAEHDVAAEHFEKYAQGVIDGNIKVSDTERKMIDLLIEKGIISVDTETDTQTSLDETNKKIDEQIAELNLNAKAIGLNAQEKAALINVTEEENKKIDETRETLQQMAAARGADTKLLDEQNSSLRTFIGTADLAAISTEEIADATTILIASREDDIRATQLEEASLRNLLETIDSSIDSTNLTVEGMQKMIQGYDDIANATRIATSDIAAWHVELKAESDIDRETYVALDDLASRYGITIPDAIKAKGIPAIKEFIESMVGTTEAVRKMKEETTKAFNDMATSAQESIGDLIDEAIVEGDAKKVKKELKDIGLEADQLTAVQRILTVAIDDKGFEGDLNTLNDLMREEFGKMQGFAVEDANELVTMFSGEMQDEFGKQNPEIGNVVNQVWEYVKQNAPAGATGDYLLQQFGEAMHDPSVVQKALDGSLVQPVKKGGQDAAMEIENEASKIPGGVANALNSGKAVIQNATIVSIKDPVTGEIKQIPVAAQSELAPIEGVFSTEFLKASAVATGHINMMLADITKSFGFLKANIGTELTEIIGLFNDFATNTAPAFENVGLQVLMLQQTFSDFSTSIATYTDSMTKNIENWLLTTAKDFEVYQKVVIELWGTFSDFSESVATYADSMTKNLTAFADDTTEAFNQLASDIKSGVWATMSDFSKSMATYSKSMASNVDSAAESMIDSLENFMDTVGDAIDAVSDFIDELNSIPKKITVTIEQKFTSTGTKYYAKGGSFLVTSTTHIGDKIVGEEGPEIVTVTPLKGKGSSDNITANIGLPGSTVGNVPLGGAAGPGIRGGGAGGGNPIVVNVRGNINATLRTQSGRVLAEETMPYMMEGTNGLT